MQNVKMYRSLVPVGNVDIFCRDTQTPGEVILCLHGRWGRGETWVDLVNRYGNAYRIICPDLRGHGLSSKPVDRYTAEAMADDMLGLLDKLGIESVILIGHSMGGHIAGCLAAKYPERVSALAILDKSAAGPDASSVCSTTAFSDPLTKDWPLPFSSLQEAKAYIRSVMDTDLSYDYFMNSLIETIEGYQMMFSAQAVASNIAEYHSWFDLLPSIQAPVMLARAKGSGAVLDDDFAEMQRLIPVCWAYEVAHPDHNIHLGNKDEFYGYFDDFLQKCRAWDAVN